MNVAADDAVYITTCTCCLCSRLAAHLYDIDDGVDVYTCPNCNPLSHPAARRSTHARCFSLKSAFPQTWNCQGIL